MNRDDMLDLNLHEGDSASLRSPHGEMKDLIIQPFNLPRNNLMAYFPEANVLIGRERDLRSQTPAFKSVPVKVLICEK